MDCLRFVNLWKGSSYQAIVDHEVCHEKDLNNNEMKAFQVVGRRVLLVKQDGKVSAIGSFCTHYMAPLEKGVLSNARVRCPWHGACFNITTGDIEEFPGLDCLRTYPVRVSANGKVIIRASRKQLEDDFRIKKMSPRSLMDGRTFVVIGGGAASLICVETLRQEGFAGRLILITKESYYPYDRVKLSKHMWVKFDDIELRPSSFYKDHSIEVRLETKVEAVDLEQHYIRTKPMGIVRYHSLFIASGVEPVRPPNVPGSELKNIFTLRNMEDMYSIRENILANNNIAIIGSSFLGMEIAAYMTGRVKTITVLSTSYPFRSIFGDIVGKRIQRMFEEKGVTIKTNVELSSFKGKNKVLIGLKLKSGEVIHADMCVVAIGSIPCTDFISDTSILDRKGCIIVNKYLETNIPNVYAGGDVAKAPLSVQAGDTVNLTHWQIACYHGRLAALNMLGQKKEISTVPFFWTALFNTNIKYAGGDVAKAPLSVQAGDTVNLTHWQIACYHGRLAALNMLGQKKEISTVPFFWTALFNTNIKYAGYAPEYNDVLIYGDLEEMHFVAYYCMDNFVKALATCNMDPLASFFAEWLSIGKILFKTDIQEAENGEWWANSKHALT